MQYENRIVAYIDILGFKDIIDKTVKDGNDVEEEIDRIIQMNAVIRKTWFLDEKKGQPFTVKAYKGGQWVQETFTPSAEDNDKGKMVTIFSDTIVVSFLVDTESAVFTTLMELQWLILNLANRGILCRGAISHGKLIHDDKKVFGPALVSAYTMESKAALYPRVILGDEILALAGINHASHHEPIEEVDYVLDLLGRDSDGMYYIDYLDSVRIEFDDWMVGYPKYLNEIYNIISRGINSPKEDVKVKYMWLRERYNETIEALDIPKLVEGLLKEGKEKEAQGFTMVNKHEG